MEILLIAAIAVVAAAALYVAVTFDLRARQSTAPLLEEAVRKMSDQLRAAEESMRRQLRALADDLQRDREQQRLDGRKIQGRLDHADSRVVSVANQFLADLDAIKRRTDQAVAQQDQLAAGLRYLDQRVARLSEALGHPTAPPAPPTPPATLTPIAPLTPLAPSAPLVHRTRHTRHTYRTRRTCRARAGHGAQAGRTSACRIRPAAACPGSGAEPGRSGAQDRRRAGPGLAEHGVADPAGHRVGAAAPAQVPGAGARGARTPAGRIPGARTPGPACSSRLARTRSEVAAPRSRGTVMPW